MGYLRGMQAAVYNLTLEPRDRYLYAHVDGGESSSAVLLAYWSEIARERLRIGADRVLCIQALAGQGAASNVEQIVAGLVAMGFKGVRIAYVNMSDDATLLVGGEIHAQKQGLVARVFRRFDEAERWLLEDHPGTGGCPID